MLYLFNLVLWISLIIQTVSECNENNCPSYSGECIESYCLCAPGFTTFYLTNQRNEDINVFCNYAYKYKEWAIWFELTMPFGVGHFYSQRYFHGMLKFILFWFLSFVKVIFKKKVRGYPDLEKVAQILLWVFGIMYCIDYCGFTFDYYLDGNQMKML